MIAGSGGSGFSSRTVRSRIAKLNDIDPEAYLRLVLARIADHAISRIDEWMPRVVAGQRV